MTEVVEHPPHPGGEVSSSLVVDTDGNVAPDPERPEVGNDLGGRPQLMVHFLTIIMHLHVLEYRGMEVHRTGDVTFVVCVRLTCVNETHAIGTDQRQELSGGNDFVRYHSSVIADLGEIRKPLRRPYAWNFLSTSTPLCPPNPKLLDIATFTSIFCPTFGT